MKRITFIPLLTALLGACANGTYVPPTVGRTATISFVGKHRYVYVDDGNSCETRHLIDNKYWSGTSVRAIGRVWIDQGIDTRAGPYGGYFCGLSLSFEPREGVSYVSEYITEDSRCRVVLSRLTPQGEKVNEPTVKRETLKRCVPPLQPLPEY